MGILNITSDSFYDGGSYQTVEKALERVGQMLEDGADIIDVGAQSTRPGAQLKTAIEEEQLLVPVIEEIVRTFPHVLVSVDTFRAGVAEKTIRAGAHIINDVSGGNLDPEMLDTIAKLQIPYIVMHMRGTPETMQQMTDYDDVVNDIAVELGYKISALRAKGVKDIIIDPGFGFSKTIDQNYELLHRVDQLHYFHLPILGGISRKSMIYKKLGVSPQEALPGTIALNTLLLQKGVQLLRVHDVKEAKQLVEMLFV